MKNVDEVVLFLIVAIVVVMACTGCAVPAILGVKTYQSGDTRIEFITGVDFGFGMNGVDKVDNNRGIAPAGGYVARGNPKTQEVKY